MEILVILIARLRVLRHFNKFLIKIINELAFLIISFYVVCYWLLPFLLVTNIIFHHSNKFHENYIIIDLANHILVWYFFNGNPHSNRKFINLWVLVFILNLFLRLILWFLHNISPTFRWFLTVEYLPVYLHYSWS